MPQEQRRLNETWTFIRKIALKRDNWTALNTYSPVWNVDAASFFGNMIGRDGKYNKSPTDGNIQIITMVIEIQSWTFVRKIACSKAYCVMWTVIVLWHVVIAAKLSKLP